MTEPTSSSASVGATVAADAVKVESAVSKVASLVKAASAKVGPVATGAVIGVVAEHGLGVVAFILRHI